MLFRLIGLESVTQFLVSDCQRPQKLGRIQRSKVKSSRVRRPVSSCDRANMAYKAAPNPVDSLFEIALVSTVLDHMVVDIKRPRLNSCHVDLYSRVDILEVDERRVQALGVAVSPEPLNIVPGWKQASAKVRRLPTSAMQSNFWDSLDELLGRLALAERLLGCLILSFASPRGAGGRREVLVEPTDGDGEILMLDGRDRWKRRDRFSSVPRILEYFKPQPLKPHQHLRDT